jgi:hypothetical protein
VMGRGDRGGAAISKGVGGAGENLESEDGLFC